MSVTSCWCYHLFVRLSEWASAWGVTSSTGFHRTFDQCIFIWGFFKWWAPPKPLYWYGSTSCYASAQCWTPSEAVPTSSFKLFGVTLRKTDPRVIVSRLCHRGREMGLVYSFECLCVLGALVVTLFLLKSRCFRTSNLLVITLAFPRKQKIQTVLYKRALFYGIHVPGTTLLRHFSLLQTSKYTERVRETECVLVMWQVSTWTCIRGCTLAEYNILVT